MNDFIHHGTALPPEARQAQYKENRTHFRLVEALRKQQTRLGYLCGITGLAAAGCMAFASVYMASRPSPPPIAYVINQQTGEFGPAVPLSDAPRYYTSVMIEGEARDYIDRRESYFPQLDKVYWAKVRAMSDVAVFTPYDAFVNSRESPKREFGLTGSITIDNVHMLGEPLRSEDNTYGYQFSFDRHPVKGSSILPVETCKGSLGLQFHPDIKLFAEDAQLNRMGTEVVGYEVIKPCKLKDTH